MCSCVSCAVVHVQELCNDVCAIVLSASVNVLPGISNQYKDKIQFKTPITLLVDRY